MLAWKGVSKEANFYPSLFLALFLNCSVILWLLKTNITLEVTYFRLKIKFFKEFLFLGPQTRTLAGGPRGRISLTIIFLLVPARCHHCVKWVEWELLQKWTKRTWKIMITSSNFLFLQISNFNTFDGHFNRLDQHGTAARVFPMPQQVKNYIKC